MKWSIWRSAVAGVLIGVVEAAGLAAIRPAPRTPLRVVRPADRIRADPLAGLGIWFLDPLPDPRPRRWDLRRPARVGRLTIIIPHAWRPRRVFRDPGLYP